MGGVGGGGKRRGFRNCQRFQKQQSRQSPRRDRRPGRDLDQAQLIVVRRLALPSVDLGNPTLIDTEIGRDIVLHMPEGNPPLDLTDGLISQFCADTVRWPYVHCFYLFHVRPVLTGPFRCGTRPTVIGVLPGCTFWPETSCNSPQDRKARRYSAGLSSFHGAISSKGSNPAIVSNTWAGRFPIR